jgi:hypothetical protein
MRRPKSAPVTTLLLAVLPLALSPAGHAQALSAAPQTIEDALHQMSDLAGVIFVGEVTAVRHPNADPGSSGFVEVDFRIDQAVRGCTTGSTYTLREWAGLWQGGDERYRPGHRLLMLLHSPNAAGISSPVAGMDGAIPLRAAASVSLATSTAVTNDATLPDSPPTLNVDLRWIGTHLHRPLPFASSASTLTSQAVNSLASTETSTPPPQQEPVSSIVGMLGAWHQALP